MRGVSERKIKVLHIDVGGCEGCASLVLRTLPLLRGNFEIHSKYIEDEVNLTRHYDVALVTGSICLNDEEEVSKLRKVREVTNIVVALGSCAAVGGVTLFARGGQEPKPEHRVWQPIGAVVEVDYVVPGCPPAPVAVRTLLENIVSGKGYFLNVFASAAKMRKFSGYDLMDDVVLTGLCVGCGACVLSCPTHALQMIERHPDLIPEKCIRCGTCYVRCPRASQLLIKRFLVKPKVLSGGSHGQT